ncbi:NADase-type glycan-binding domain-containing protein [Streptomyces sp. NPDC001443]
MSGPGEKICPNCGHHNAPDAAFCASCNEFLEWEESGTGSAGVGRTTTPAPRAAVAEPALSGPAVPSPAAPSPVTPATVTPDASASGPSAQAAAATGPEPATARTAPLPPRPETPPTVPAPERTVPSPAVPLASAAPAEPVRPGASAERGVSGTVRRPGERPADPDDVPASPDTQDTTAPRPVPPADDLICAACTQANPRTRTLCLRCGAVLGAAVVQEERLSWWARLLRRLRRRPPRPLAAGQRPRVRAWRRPSLAIPITLVLLLGGGYLAKPHLSGLIDSLRNKTAEPTPVNPKFAQASSHLKNHGPNLAFDGANNTYWAPASGGAGTGEALEARFEQPVTLEQLIIHTGVSVNKDEFLKQARPSVIDVELGEQGGKVEKKQLKLEDKPGPQTLDLEGKNVSTVRFVVRSSYGAEAKNRHTAILEVEFFGLRQ